MSPRPNIDKFRAAIERELDTTSARRGFFTKEQESRLPRDREEGEKRIIHAASVVHASIRGCVEVQIMEVNHRWVIATNGNSTGAAAFNNLRDRAGFCPPSAKMGLRRVAEGFIKHDDGILQRHARKLLAMSCSRGIRYAEVVGRTLQDIHANMMLTDDKYKGHLIVVTDARPVSDAHAEQKLAWLLWKNRDRNVCAYIMGTKRPCAICHLTLHSMNKWHLIHLNNALRPPGLLWEGGPGDFFEFMIGEAKISQSKVDEVIEELARPYQTHVTQDRNGQTTTRRGTVSRAFLAYTEEQLESD